MLVWGSLRLTLVSLRSHVTSVVPSPNIPFLMHTRMRLKSYYNDDVIIGKWINVIRLPQTNTADSAPTAVLPSVIRPYLVYRWAYIGSTIASFPGSCVEQTKSSLVHIVSVPDPFRKNLEGVWQHVLQRRVRANCTVRTNQVAEFSYVMFIKNV